MLKLLHKDAENFERVDKKFGKLTFSPEKLEELSFISQKIKKLSFPYDIISDKGSEGNASEEE
jgi:hypothetical protein